MNEETEIKILKLLDVIAVEVAAGRNDTADLSAKVDSLDVKVDRIERRLGRVETRVENVETELRSFRHEFERRIAPLER
jgi:chaperonin cofactor prefoldin